MKVLKLQTLVRRLPKLNDEIRYQSCFAEKQFTAGLIAFRARKRSDPKRIRHNDQDVICHVLKGRGRLHVNGRRIQLRPGTLCHIRKGTPHDFVAGKRGELLLFYWLIKTK
jgi:quercetin dioxygenase-like cupin family protein